MGTRWNASLPDCLLRAHKKSSRNETISTDTDRLKIRDTAAIQQLANLRYARPRRAEACIRALFHTFLLSAQSNLELYANFRPRLVVDLLPPTASWSIRRSGQASRGAFYAFHLNDACWG